MVINVIAEQINFTAFYGNSTKAWKLICLEAHIAIVTLTVEFFSNSNEILHRDQKMLTFSNPKQKSVLTYSIFAIMGIFSPLYIDMSGSMTYRRSLYFVHFGIQLIITCLKETRLGSD